MLPARLNTGPRDDASPCSSMAVASTRSCYSSPLPHRIVHLERWQCAFFSHFCFSTRLYLLGSGSIVLTQEPWLNSTILSCLLLPHPHPPPLNHCGFVNALPVAPSRYDARLYSNGDYQQLEGLRDDDSDFYDNGGGSVDGDIDRSYLSHSLIV